MTGRTYNQFCGVAEALDVLGDRWTLLVVRDLLPGPQRFTDLAGRQPAMSTDMLTSRLRSLEAHGVVERVPLPAPARGSMYRMTSSGEQLRGVIGELARVGSQWLPDPASTDRRLEPSWALATIAEHFDVEAPTRRGLTVESERGADSLLVEADRSVRAVYGSLDDADVVMTGPPREVLGVLIGRIRNDDAPNVQVTGTPHDVSAWRAAVRSAVPFLHPS